MRKKENRRNSINNRCVFESFINKNIESMTPADKNNWLGSAIVEAKDHIH